MLDFDGWWSNWEWSSEISSEVPGWLDRVALPAGLLGAAALALSWLGLDVRASAWMWLPLVTLALEVFVSVAWDVELSRLPFGHAFCLAGLLAIAGLLVPDPAVGRPLAVIGPCLALASLPLLTRAWGATLFSNRMVAYATERKRELAAALSGDSSDLVVRVDAIDHSELDLVTVGTRPEQRLRASTDLLRRSLATQGAHFLLTGVEIGEPEPREGYRDRARGRRLHAIANASYLGSTPDTIAPSAYADEVRAGVLVFAAHHALIVMISLFVATLST